MGGAAKPRLILLDGMRGIAAVRGLAMSLAAASALSRTRLARGLALPVRTTGGPIPAAAAA